MDASPNPPRRRRTTRTAIVAAFVGAALVLATAAALLAPSWRASSDDDATARARDVMPPRLREPALASRPTSNPESEPSQATPSDAPPRPSPPALASDVDPVLRARIRLVDGATGRTLGDDDLESARAGGFSTSLGGMETVSVVVPESRQWVPADPTRPSFELERRVTLFSARPSDVTSADVVWPLYRASEIRLRVLDAAGRSVPDARLRGWVGLGRSEKADVKASGDGVVRLSGLPFLPREVVWLVVTTNVADANVPESIGSAHRDTKGLHAVARVVLPDVWTPSIDATLALDASSAILDAELADHNETDNDFPSAFGTLRIRARHRDGTAAAGVVVRIAGAATRDMWTDATGRVEANVPAHGPLLVSLADVSLVPTTVGVTPRENETVDVLLDEPEPASLDVLVSFVDGRRVPFARLSVVTPSGVPAWDLVDGTLRLDPFTDENGSRVYTRVEPAEVTVSAKWGSRHAATQVRLSPRHRGIARLVLPDPPDQRPAGLGVPDELPVISMPRER